MNRNMMGGIIILVVIGLLFALVFFFRGGMPGGLTFQLQFEEAKGLKVGDFIYMQGVKIGEIREVGFEHGKVVAEARIYSGSDTHLPVDSFFFIWPDQIITGKQCVIVEPGKSAQAVARGAIIQGESSKMKIILRLGPDKAQEIFGMIRDYFETR